MRIFLRRHMGCAVTCVRRSLGRAHTAGIAGGRSHVLQPFSRAACNSTSSSHRCQFSSHEAQLTRFSSTCRASSVAEPQHAQQDKSGISLYSDAALYDSVFSTRQFENEADFLLEAFKVQSGRQPESFLELGCGPARHSVLLAARGLRGYAVDNSQAMLEYARGAAAAAGVSLQCTCADMRRDAPAIEEQVDLAFMLCGTVSHLTTNADALACFTVTAASLNPGGLFIVEMAHPVDVFNGYVEVGDCWEVEDPQRGKLLVHYGADDGSDAFDAMTQTLVRTVTVTADQGGVQERLARDTVRQRFFTSQEVDLLARASGLEVAAQYGGLTVPFKALDDEDSYALVVVLRKR